MWIPGFGSDELRPYKKAAPTEAHKQVYIHTLYYDISSLLFTFKTHIYADIVTWLIG